MGADGIGQQIARSGDFIIVAFSRVQALSRARGLRLL